MASVGVSVGRQAEDALQPPTEPPLPETKPLPPPQPPPPVSAPQPQPPPRPPSPAGVKAEENCSFLPLVHNIIKWSPRACWTWQRRVGGPHAGSAFTFIWGARLELAQGSSRPVSRTPSPQGLFPHMCRFQSAQQPTSRGLALGPDGQEVTPRLTCSSSALPCLLLC
ncbi:mediator of RNA polymerase II transcription subunit 9 isoform X2 [Pseudorca crassidens]|uniref:mediator of RNA polymerase II transcription subunit 9 isoform X2 n=1 Tax=Pseudorca crassidens TaxID=82174 RepID=UPI00352D0470